MYCTATFNDLKHQQQKCEHRHIPFFSCKLCFLNRPQEDCYCCGSDWGAAFLLSVYCKLMAVMEITELRQEKYRDQMRLQHPEKSEGFL